MGLPEMLANKLTVINDQLDETLIQLAMRQHSLDRKAAARFVQDQVRDAVTTQLMRN